LLRAGASFLSQWLCFGSESAADGASRKAGIEDNSRKSKLGTIDKRNCRERVYAFATGTGMLGTSRQEAHY
jgi:hypothetical protein